MNRNILESVRISVALAVSLCLIFAMMPFFSDGNAATAKTFELKYTIDEHVALYVKDKKAVNNGKYKAGTVFDVKVDKEYDIKHFYVNNEDKGVVDSYTAVSGDIKNGKITINAETEKITEKSKVTLYRTDKIAGKCPGTVTGISDTQPKGKLYVNKGEDKKIEIKANSGYYLIRVKVDGKNMGRAGSVIITGDGQPHKVKADFAKADLKIKVDPGHAGKYNKGAAAGYYESEMVWKLSNYLVPYLKKYPGIKPTMTKSSLAEDPGVYERGTRAKGNDLFLSIHSNSSGSKANDYPLTIVSYCKRQLYNVAQPLGVKLAKGIRTTMKTREPHQVWVKQLPSGRDWFGVIRGASDVNVPGIIIEHSFHSNPKKAAWLMKKANLKKLAKMEAKTISKYYGINKDGSLVKPGVPKTLSVKSGKAGTSRITISWKKGPVTGYEVFRSTSLKGSYSKQTNTAARSFKNTELKKGKKYYYKVRAYRCNGKKISYSDFTTPKSAVVK